METFVTFVCIAVASFAVLAQPAVAQGANATLPLTYPGEVVPGDGSQTCPSKEKREIERNKVDNATLSLLRESVIPLLQGYSCGGSTGWRRVAYLNMSDPTQQCPSVCQEITTPHRVCGRRSTRASCEGLTYITGSEQYDPDLSTCSWSLPWDVGVVKHFTMGAGLPFRPHPTGERLLSLRTSAIRHSWAFIFPFRRQNWRFSVPRIY